MQKSKIWDIVGAVGMLLGVLIASYSWMTTFGNVPLVINDWRWGVGFGLLVFFVSATLFIYKLYSVSTWAEPEVRLIHSYYRFLYK